MVEDKTLQGQVDPGTEKPVQQDRNVLLKVDDNFFNDVYSEFWNRGYSGDKNDFFQLLCSNDQACNDAYEIVLAGGYNGTQDEFEQQMGLDKSVEKKNPNATQENGPGVLEDTSSSSESQETDPFKLANEKAESNNSKAWEEFTAYIDRKNKEAGRETPPPRDQGEFKAITEVEEQYRISKGEMKARKERKERLRRVAEGKEEISLQDSALTSLANGLNQIVGTETWAQWGLSLILKEAGELGIKDELKDLTGIDSDVYFAEQNARKEKMKSYVGPTLGFTDMTTLKMPVMTVGGLQFVDVPEPTLDNAGKFVAGFFNATTSFMASAAQARLTGGVGLATDLIARGIDTYNESKANDLGISSRELYETNQQEILPGLIVGTLSYGLEKLGIDEVLSPSLFKNLPPGAIKNLVDGVVASSIEGGTEYSQAILEKANELLAKRNPGDIGKILGEYMTSKEALEALYQGMAGGYSMSTLRQGYDFITAVKTDEQTKRVRELVTEIKSIEDQITKPHFTNEEKMAMKQTRNAYVEEIRSINEQVDDLAKVLPNEAVEKIKQLYQEQLGLNNQLINVINSENLTEEQKEQVIDALEKQFKERATAISDLIKSYGYDSKAGQRQEFVREKGDVVSQEKSETKRPMYYYGNGVDLSDDTQLQKYKEELDDSPDSDQTSLLSQATKAMEAISNILPDVNYVFHKTNESFVEAVGEESESRGGFVPTENTIHINVSKANDTTVAHETFHALLRNVANGEILQSSVKELLDAVAPDIAGTPLAQKIQEFAENYDTNMQNEEALTQLFAEFAASQDKFKPSTRQKIKLWLNKTAQRLGIGNLYSDRDIKDAEIKSLLNTLSSKLYDGKKITAKEVLSLNTKNLNKFIEGEPLEPGSDLGNIRVSGDTKTSGRKINLQLVNRLGVNTDKIQRGTIKDLDGAKAFVFAADQAVVGRIMSPTGVEHDFMGGFLYPYLGQGAWAFTDEANARKALNKAKETDGVGLVMAQANTGILGSNTFQQYAIKEIYNAVNNGADTQYIVDRVNTVLNSKMGNTGMTFAQYLTKKNLPTSISTIQDLETLFPYTGPNATNYLSRNKFYEKLFNAGMENNAGIPRFNFGEKVQNRNSLHGITMSEYVNDPALKNIQYGDIVSAIQFDKNSPIIDSRTTTKVKTHPSYPFVLQGKPIMVFNEAYDVRQIAPDFVPKTGNQTPLGKREKSFAARAAMGGQPTAQIKEVQPEEALVLLQKTTPKKISQSEVDKALSTDKTSQRIIAKNITPKEGDKVGVRLNLNVMKNTGVPVQTIHKGTKGEGYKKVDGKTGLFRGEAIQYAAAVTLKDAHFNTHQKSIYEVKNGIKNKFPLASVDGEYQDIPLADQNYNGTEIRFNPKDTQLFETVDGRPVRRADEVTLSGTRVYARGKIDYFTDDNRPDPFKPSKALLQKASKEDVEAFDKLYDDSEKLAESLIQPKETRTRKTLKRLGKTFDRQRDAVETLSVVKGEGEKDARGTFRKMKLSQGANGAAAAQFDEYYVRAFQGLKKKDRKDLNKIAQLRRIIAINEKRQKDNKPAYERVAGDIRMDDVKARQLLKYKEEELGTKKFVELSNRAKAAFDGFANNLKISYESGRINEATYLRFKDVEYSPMIVIQEMLQDNEGLYEGENFDHIMLKYGLSKGDIKTLTDQNSKEIINDLQWLLRMHTAVTMRKAFHNDMLSRLAKAYEKNPEALADVVKPNPVTRDKNGRPIYKYKSDMDKGRPQNTSVLKYYDNGDPKYLLLDTDFARQLLDIKSTTFTQVSNIVKKFGIDILLGAKPLRYMATIGNPIFTIPAATMDFSNILLNNNIYSSNLLKAAPELAWDASRIVLRKFWSDSAPIRRMMAKRFGKELNTEDKFKKLYTEWALHGGSMDFLSREGIADLQRKKQANLIKSTAGEAALVLGEAISYFGATSEMTFRLAAYMKQKENLIREYKKAEGIMPRGEDLTAILEEAALASRNTINFSDGGATLKMMDQVMPYLNAAFQGFRKVPQAFKESPKETSFKYLQMASFAVAVPFFQYAILMALTDDEDEAKKAMKKMQDDTGVWERSQYLLIPKSIKDDGEIDYFRFRKNPVTAPISSIFGEVGNLSLNYMTGVDTKYDFDVVSHSFKHSLPFNPNDLLNRIPTLSAYATYISNEDTFFNEKIFYEPYGLDVLPQDEGLYKERVNNIYKIIGQSIPQFGELVGADIEGLSPIRLQAAVEKVITNPKTNPMISFAYNTLNAVPTKYGGGYTSFKDYFDAISKDVSAKLVRTTNPKIKTYDSDNKKKLELSKAQSEIYVKEEEIKAMIRKHVKENKDARNLTQEMKDKINEGFPRQQKATYRRKFTRYMRNRDVDYSYFDIAYQQNAEVQARTIYRYFGKDIEPQDKRVLKAMAKKIGGRISDKAWSIYRDISKE